MILESDTQDGICRACGEEFPFIYGVGFESQLHAHVCPNQEKLHTLRFADMHEKINALLETQTRLLETVESISRLIVQLSQRDYDTGLR